MPQALDAARAPPVTLRPTPGTFAASPCRVTFVGHFHRWLAATPEGALAWDGGGPILLDPGRRYLVAVDNDGKTWKAWGNTYWPSVYLIDKKGDVRYRWDGELDWKGAKGQEKMQKKIEEVLGEKE